MPATPPPISLSFLANRQDSLVRHSRITPASAGRTNRFAIYGHPAWDQPRIDATRAQRLVRLLPRG